MNPQPEHMGPWVERVGKEGDHVPSPLVGWPCRASASVSLGDRIPIPEAEGTLGVGVCRFTPFLVQAPRGLSPQSPVLGFLISRPFTAHLSSAPWYKTSSA